ncbi:unnamed protein product [Caenorhabditis brenneri]
MVYTENEQLVLFDFQVGDVKCPDFFKPDDCYGMLTLNFFSPPIFAQSMTCIFNFVVQLLGIRLIFDSKKFKKAMSLISELLELDIWRIDYQLDFIAYLNIFNYLPELSLPLLLVCSDWNQRRRVFVAASRTRSQILVKQGSIGSNRVV